MIKLIDINDVPIRNIKQIEIIRDIEYFLASDFLAAEVTVPNGRSPASVCIAYRNAIKKNNYNMSVSSKMEHVYLIKKELGRETDA